MDSTSDGDTRRITLGATPWPAPAQAAGAALVIGGWPRILRDGGGSTTMVIGERVVNSPSDRTGEREVGSALFIMKRGR